MDLLPISCRLNITGLNSGDSIIAFILSKVN